MTQFDMTEVSKMFLRRGYGQRQDDLTELFRREFTFNYEAKRFMAQLATVIAENDLKPLEALMFIMRHGCALGVLLERERAEREAKKLIA